MRLLRPTFSLAIAIALIAGCSGGGNSTSPTQKAVLANGKTPIGTTSITITLPRNVQYASHGKSTSSTARSPKFVDPAPGPSPSSMPQPSTAVIYIYNSTGGNDIVLPLANGLSSDGYTFTASNIPVYQSGQYIYVYEYTDSTLSTELAGTYDYVIGTVGGSGQINLVMNMLVKYLAWTTYTNGYGAQIIDGTSSTDPQQCGNELLYFFPTDALGGFIAAPYGGIPNVVLESQSSENSGTSKLVRNPDGTYSPLWDSNYDSIDVTFSFDGTFFSNPTVQTTIQYNDYNCE